MKSVATTFSSYVKDLPADRQTALKHLRALAKKVAPDATELISHGMPFYDLHGPLFAIASQKHYLSLYVCDTELLASYKARLPKNLSVGKSCIRFRTLDELPLDVIEELMVATVTRSRAVRRVGPS